MIKLKSKLKSISFNFSYSKLYIFLKRDNWGRKLCHVVAIDATYFRNPQLQYTISSMLRELTKAYVGFYLPEPVEHLNYGIATGNWGCGAFNGDRQLKGIVIAETCFSVIGIIIFL